MSDQNECVRKHGLVSKNGGVPPRCPECESRMWDNLAKPNFDSFDDGDEWNLVRCKVCTCFFVVGNPTIAHDETRARALSGSSDAKGILHVYWGEDV